MNNIQKIYGGLIVLGVCIIAGCTSFQNKENGESQHSRVSLPAIVSEVQKRSAYFGLEQVNEDTVALVLYNPNKEPIQSFSAEILFPPHLVFVKNLTNTSDDIFGLHISSDWVIDNNTGKISIASASSGNAQTVSSHSNTSFSIAQFQFEKKQKERSFVFDINENVSNIFVLDNGKIRNDTKGTPLPLVKFAAFLEIAL